MAQRRERKEDPRHTRPARRHPRRGVEPNWLCFAVPQAGLCPRSIASNWLCFARPVEQELGLFREVGRASSLTPDCSAGPRSWNWLCFAEPRSFAALGSRDARCCVSAGCPCKLLGDWLCFTVSASTPHSKAPRPANWLCFAESSISVRVASSSEAWRWSSCGSANWLCFTEFSTRILAPYGHANPSGIFDL